MEIRITKISKKLRTLREEKQFTQEELAKALGVSRQSIISLEQGRCLPSLPLALGFTEIFEKPMEEIFDLRKEVNRMATDLTPFSPEREVGSLHEAIDRLFEESWPKVPTTTFPQLNIYEKEGKVIVEADVPGVAEEDLSIEAGEDSLTLRGQRRSEKEIKEKDYYRKETSFGVFSRTIPLPALVNKDKAEAELKNGTLIISIPKKKEVRPKVTKVKVKKS
jgi:HSP20 family protein